MMFSITTPEVLQAEENLQSAIAMMKANAAHMKSFFSHDQAEAIRNLIGAGGIHGGLEVLVVTTSKGAFLGSGLADVKMSPIKDLNEAVYGKDHDMNAILSKPGANFSEPPICAHT